MIIEQDGFTFEITPSQTAALKAYKGKETSLVIPWEVNGCPVDTIGDWAFGKFFGSNPLTYVSIPDTVSRIGAYAFNNCAQIAHLFIPATLTHMGVSAFSGCVALTEITIPVGVTTLPDRLFNGCRSLEQLTLHDGITAIGKGACAGCRSLKTLSLPLGVSRIEYETFKECRSLTNINIHENITHIGHYAFSNCVSLSHITLPDTVTYIGHKDALPLSIVIHACYGSPAEKYAKKYYFAFKPIFPESGETGLQSNCEIMASALQKIKAAQGEAAFADARIFKGLISDFLPGRGKNAGFRNILYAAVEELHIYKALKDAKKTGDYIITSRLISALVDLGYQESLAKETISCFETII